MQVGAEGERLVQLIDGDSGVGDGVPELVLDRHDDVTLANLEGRRNGVSKESERQKRNGRAKSAELVTYLVQLVDGASGGLGMELVVAWGWGFQTGP